MTQEEFKMFLYKCEVAEDFSSLVNVPYETRKYFFDMETLINLNNMNVFNYYMQQKIKGNLFTEQEAQRIINNYKNNPEKYYLLTLSLSDEEKSKLVTQDVFMNMDNYNQKINNLLSTIKDESFKYEMINKIFDGYEADFTYYLTILNDEYRYKFFSEQIVNYKELDTFSFIPNILSNLKEEERFNAFKLIFSNPSVVKNYEYSIMNVIKLLPKENQFEAFKMFFSNFKIDPYGYSNYIYHFKDNNFKEIMHLFKEKYVSDKYSYSWDIEKLILENPEKYIDLSFELNDELGFKIFSTHIFTNSISKFSAEEQYKLFEKYVVEQKKFNVKDILSSTYNLDFKYMILEYWIQTSDKTDKFSIVDDFLYNGTKFPNGSIQYNIINKLYCDHYQINQRNFSDLIKIMGYKVINYLKNENIINILKLSPEEFDKVMYLFNNENIELNGDVINTVCNSILQREFRLKNPIDYNIFSLAENCFSSEDPFSKDVLLQYIEKIKEVIPLNSYLEKYNVSIDEFVDNLVYGEKNL